MYRKVLSRKKTTFALPELDENATPTQNEMWKICANNTNMKATGRQS